MPSKLMTQPPCNKPGWGLTYGWAVRHTTPTGTDRYMVWSDDTCPEMSPSEQRYRAIRHAQQLIVDGGVYPDQLAVVHYFGAHGTYELGAKDLDILDDYTPDWARRRNLHERGMKWQRPTARSSGYVTRDGPRLASSAP